MKLQEVSIANNLLNNRDFLKKMRKYIFDSNMHIEDLLLRKLSFYLRYDFILGLAYRF